jgi:hypothetical protein
VGPAAASPPAPPLLLLFLLPACLRCLSSCSPSSISFECCTPSRCTHTVTHSQQGHRCMRCACEHQTGRQAGRRGCSMRLEGPGIKQGTSNFRPQL